MSTPRDSCKFNYKDLGDALPAEIQDVLRILDVDGTGCVNKQAVQDLVASGGAKTARGSDWSGDGPATSVIVKDLGLSSKRVTGADMARVHSNVQQLQGEKATYRRMVCGMLVAVMLLSVGMFALCFAAVELSKETTVQGQSITTRSGDVALIGSTDTEVVDGMFVSRSAGDGVCSNATGTCTRHALATRPSQEKRALTSRISNEVFKNLDTITFSFSADSSSTMTYRIHGFVRAKSARSEHGTVVHLRLLDGTLTLDGSTIYLDSSLSSHLESFGLIAAGQQVYAHGRRLQEGTAAVVGIFSMFDDLVFEELPDDYEKPRAPSMPYQMTVLERMPCPTVDACTSTVVEGEYLPGYDAATNSIAIRVEIIETESWVMTIARYPNHPTQQLLTFTDHVAQTTRQIQFTSPEIFTRCRSENYTAPSHFSSDDWYVTYVQDVEKPEAVYDFLDESYTVNSSINRYFHLISKNVSADTPDQDAIMEFEDDKDTLQMKRAYVPNAAAEGWDLQETIVLEVEEMNDADAAAILEDYAELFLCGNESDDTVRSDFPVVDDPFDETLEQVLFYTQEFVEIDSLGFGSYWNEAVVGQGALLQLYAIQQAELEAVFESNITNESDRRLASISGVPSSSSSFCIPSKKLSSKDTAVSFCHGLTCPNRRSDCPGCRCDSFTVAGGPGANDMTGGSQSGWFGSGTVSIGNFCVSPGSFGVSGYVEAGYVAMIKEKKKGVGFECSLKAFGAVSGTYGKYEYKCSNDKAGCLQEKEDDKAAWERFCQNSGYPIYDDKPTRRLSEDATSIEAADEMEGEPEVDEDVVDRRLGGRRRRRRRRTGVLEYSRRRSSPVKTYCSRKEWEKDWGDSRRRTRTTWGGEIALRVGAIGGCDAGPVGVGIKGHFEISFGPFPKNPLVPKNTGKMSFSACVKLVVKVCVNLFTATLWSTKI